MMGGMSGMMGGGWMSAVMWFNFLFGLGLLALGLSASSQGFGGS